VAARDRARPAEPSAQLERPAWTRLARLPAASARLPGAVLSLLSAAAQPVWTPGPPVCCPQAVARSAAVAVVQPAELRREAQ